MFFVHYGGSVVIPDSIRAVLVRHLEPVLHVPTLYIEESLNLLDLQSQRSLAGCILGYMVWSKNSLGYYLAATERAWDARFWRVPLVKPPVLI